MASIALELLAPNFTRVTVGENVYWFSYQTCVAFRAPGFGRVCSENAWSRTTGKHLNEIAPKGDGVPHEEFQRKLVESTAQFDQRHHATV